MSFRLKGQISLGNLQRLTEFFIGNDKKQKRGYILNILFFINYNNGINYRLYFKPIVKPIPEIPTKELISSVALESSKPAALVTLLLESVVN